MNRIRILLADEQTILLEGLHKLLTPEFDVVGAVEDGRSLLDAAGKLMPDIALLDLSLPLLNGIDAARQLKKRLPHIKIVFLTLRPGNSYVAEAFGAGASAYLSKRSAASELKFAIREALGGKYYLSPLAAKDMPETCPRGSHRSSSAWCQMAAGRLTARQREVLQLIAEGHANKEIAEILRISIKTVEFHKARIVQALGLYTTAELTRYAMAQGLTNEHN